MGRMLQALKNLEARSAWPVAGTGVLPHQAADLPIELPRSAPVDTRPLPPPTPWPAYASPEPPPPVMPLPVNPLRAWMTAAPSVVVEPAPPPADNPFAAVFVSSSPALTELPAHCDRPTAQTATPETVAARSSATPASRPPTGLERAVRRALDEPHRRQPIRELAQRLRQDAQETGSRSLLIVGIGSESTTHEAVLHVAALLADEGGRVLVVDGDAARRPLSLDLDAVQQPGLSDLLARDRAARELVHATAFTGLAFLPAGTQRQLELSHGPDRLARAFGELAGDYDLVLIDGGRSDDPAAGVLARLADATYVVVQLGAVEASAAQAALRALRAGGARVLGCIANE